MNGSAELAEATNESILDFRFWIERDIRRQVLLGQAAINVNGVKLKVL